MSFVVSAPGQLLGIDDLTFVSPYEVRASLVLGPWLHAPGGAPSVSALGVLLDDVLGYALEGDTARVATHWSVTTELAVDLLAPLPLSGVLRAAGRRVHVDELGAVARGEVYDATGRVVAHAHQRGRFVDARPDPDQLASGRVEHGLSLPDRAGVGDLMALLGADVDGRSVRLDVGPRVGNPLGNLHGGIALALCETAAAAAVPEPSWTSGIRVHYLRPVAPGARLVVEPTVVHAGRSLALVDVAARREDGAVCVRASVTREQTSAS